MNIVIDTREQRPFVFDGPLYSGVKVEVGKLYAGDYSLAGLDDLVAVERKSLDDLVGCLASGRERFENELRRAGGMDCFVVVVEASWQDMAAGKYRSKMNPHAACQSVISMMYKYGVPFLFSGSRAAAEYVTWTVLHQYLEVARKRFRAIVKAHEEALAVAK